MWRRSRYEGGNIALGAQLYSLFPSAIRSLPGSHSYIDVLIPLHVHDANLPEYLD